VPGSGLDNIGARVLAHGGTFTIESSLGQGTTVKGMIPVRSTARVAFDDSRGGDADIFVFPAGIYRVSGRTPSS
jgi:hypothetical protein